MTTPSKYQQAIFDWVRTGRGHALVNAVAGSGKTWTLVEASKLLKTDRALFCAFNKHIQEELGRRLPRHVTVKTLHGIGYSALASVWGKLRVNEDKVWDLAEKSAKAIHRKLERLLIAEARQTGEDIEVPDLGEVSGWLRKLVHFCRASLTSHTDAEALAKLAAPHAGARVVAEGIERSTQARVIQELGCHYAQGYFFARPMPSDKLIEHLLQNPSVAWQANGAAALASTLADRMTCLEEVE